jgi:hypothetical protein
VEAVAPPFRTLSVNFLDSPLRYSYLEGEGEGPGPGLYLSLTSDSVCIKLRIEIYTNGSE